MKTMFALGVLLVAGAGVAAAQEPAARPDTMKPKAAWDSAKAGADKAYPSQAGQQAAALDLNRATKGQLEAAGLGSHADKIIQARPFKSEKDLVEKKILTADEWKALKGKVKVGAT
jgi:DNA uptake protein ComE-like DNA-binding protein